MLEILSFKNIEEKSNEPDYVSYVVVEDLHLGSDGEISQISYCVNGD